MNMSCLRISLPTLRTLGEEQEEDLRAWEEIGTPQEAKRVN